MKTLKEIVQNERTIYKCDYCDFISYSQSTIFTHERHCSGNHQRVDENIRYMESLVGRWFKSVEDNEIFLVQKKIDKAYLYGDMSVLKTRNGRVITSTLSLNRIRNGLESGHIKEISIDDALGEIRKICEGMRNDD